MEKKLYGSEKEYPISPVDAVKQSKSGETIDEKKINHSFHRALIWIVGELHQSAWRLAEDKTHKKEGIYSQNSVDLSDEDGCCS